MCHMYAIYVPETNMSTTFTDMPYLPGAYIGDYVHTYATYEGTSINQTRGSVHTVFKLHFMSFAYITEHICLSHYKYRSHCPHSI